MGVAVRMEAKKNFRSYVDISKYTEMEIEHGHDTANQLPVHGGNHVIAGDIKEFDKVVEQQYGEIINEALKQ